MLALLVGPSLDTILVYVLLLEGVKELVNLLLYLILLSICGRDLDTTWQDFNPCPLLLPCLVVVILLAVFLIHFQVQVKSALLLSEQDLHNSGHLVAYTFLLWVFRRGTPAGDPVGQVWPAREAALGGETIRGLGDDLVL